jgi:hypothetical protein
MSPSLRIIMFSGLMSRWTIPWACAASSPVASELYGDLDRFVQRDGPFIYGLPQRRPVDELGREERHIVLLPELEYGDDVGMIKGGGGAGFLLESAQAFGVRGDVAGQHLYRDIPGKPLVLGEIDLAHPAFPDRCEDRVPAQLLPLTQLALNQRFGKAAEGRLFQIVFLV